MLFKVVFLLLCSGSLWGNNLKKNRGSVVVKWKVCFKIVYLGVFTCIWRKWIRGNLLSWVILDETSATKLSWAAIERENGFCQAPLLSPFNYQQLMETSKTWGKIDDRAKREKEKKYSIQKQAKLRNWHFGRPLQCIDYCQRNKEQKAFQILGPNLIDKLYETPEKDKQVFTFNSKYFTCIYVILHLAH